MAIRAIGDVDVAQVATAVVVAADSIGALAGPVAVVADVDGEIVVAVVAQSYAGRRRRHGRRRRRCCEALLPISIAVLKLPSPLPGLPAFATSLPWPA